MTPAMTPEAIAALPYRPCVGVILARGDGTVFAGRRIDGPPGAWQMPQGGIDPGESPEDAARRELTEETGVPPALARIEAETPGWHRYDLPHDLVPTLWGARYRGQSQKWFRMRFLGADSDVDIGGTGQAAEFAEWAWMAPADLVERIVPFKRDLYRAVLAEIGP